eukprot:TRINITY_DN24539_c0_g1_i1.p1 TRINITY_DN24539_c0_g1~~TRINITY_DN24539_c0_g1_i1.p1  ORF type:complete len:640 (+),score=78.96 TRINITY_DN24539_c0_g1_i1:79-1920(+)
MNPNFGAGQGGLRQQGGSLNLKECLVKSLQSGVLALSGRGLSTLPKEFGALDTLQYDNKTWWEEVELTKLDLSNNELSELPPGMPSFPMLGSIQQLNLMRNSLSSLPGDLFSFQTLTKLIVCDNKITTVPDEIGTAMHLSELDFSNNPIRQLPESLGNLDHLSTLKLTKCALVALPESLGGCRSLHHLDVSHNKLTAVPVSLCQLLSLSTLVLSSNQISEFPEFPPSKLLTRIDLSQNRLTLLPKRISAPFVADLVLSFNGISEISFGDVRELTSLDLRDNKISSVDFVNPSTTPKITHLNVANNNITHIDPELGSLTNLKVFSLEGNPLKSISRTVLSGGTVSIMKYLKGRQQSEGDTNQNQSTIARSSDVNGVIDLSPDPSDKIALRKGGGLSSLPLELLSQGSSATAIKCCHQNFGSLPRELGGMPGLTSVDFSANQIEVIEVVPSQLPHLRSLSLKRNRLTTLPALSQLQYLDVSANRLTILPDMSSWSGLHTLIAGDNAIQQFPVVPPCLTTLVLSGNKITQLPLQHLTHIHNLNTLDISNNELQQVPPELGCMTSLRSLLLSGNPLKTIRRAVLDKGTPALLEYLKDKIPVQGSAFSAPQGRNIRSF